MAFAGLNDKRFIGFTDDEALCVLAAVVRGLACFGEIEDAEDGQSAHQLRAAGEKIRRAVGMDQQTFLQFCVVAGGTPDEHLLKFFQEQDRLRSERRPNR